MVQAYPKRRGCLQTKEISVNGFIQILSAAGVGGVIGSLITTLVQALLASRAANRTRNFQEKKEAYIGFLEALHRSDVERTRETSMNAGHWKNRCDLVASPNVRAVIERIFETNPNSRGNAHPDRPKVIEDLRKAMRLDLGVELR
jgi:hypothetical protein